MFVLSILTIAGVVTLLFVYGRRWWLARRRMSDGWIRAKTIKVINRADGKARVCILARHDGLYEYWGETEIVGDEYEGIYWAPTDMSGLYASAEEAERDAWNEVPWLRQRAREAG
jgi:hypothetical protein